MVVEVYTAYCNPFFGEKIDRNPRIFIKQPHTDRGYPSAAVVPGGGRCLEE